MIFCNLFYICFLICCPTFSYFSVMNVNGLESTTDLVEHENNNSFNSKTPQISYVKEEILACHDNDNSYHSYFTDIM